VKAISRIVLSVCLLPADDCLRDYLRRDVVQRGTNVVTGLTGKVNFTAAFDNVERDRPDGAKGTQPFVNVLSNRLRRSVREAVTEPRFGQDVLRLGGIRFDLLSKVRDENAEIVALISVIRAPNGLQQFPMRSTRFPASSNRG